MDFSPEPILIFLEIFIIVTALGVVLSPKVLEAAFFLSGTLSGLAGIYILLNADFVAAAQIVVYVGAINVLIVFAIMLVQQQLNSDISSSGIKQLVQIVIPIFIFSVFIIVITSTNWPIQSTLATVDTTQAIGKHLFTDYLLPFEVVSILLLLALIGAIVIARRDLVIEQKELTNYSTSQLSIESKD